MDVTDVDGEPGEGEQGDVDVEEDESDSELATCTCHNGTVAQSARLCKQVYATSARSPK